MANETAGHKESERLGGIARGMTLKGLKDLGCLDGDIEMLPCIMSIFYDEQTSTWFSAFVNVDDTPGAITLGRADMKSWQEDEVEEAYRTAQSFNPGIPIVIDRTLADKFGYKRTEQGKEITVYDDPDTEKGIVAFRGLYVSAILKK